MLNNSNVSNVAGSSSNQRYMAEWTDYGDAQHQEGTEIRAVGDWNLEGRVVKAMYIKSIPVVGKVIFSRVKYGGEVQHHLLLLKSVHELGFERTHVLINHSEITEISNQLELF